MPTPMKHSFRTVRGFLFAWVFAAAFCLVFCNGIHPAYSKTRAEKAYDSAYKSYTRLAASARLRTDRRAWINVINAFRKVYQAYPDNKKVAPRVLYMVGRCYRELYGYSGLEKDLNGALKRYGLLAARFPSSSLADDALYAMGIIYLKKGDRLLAGKTFERVVREYPRGDAAGKARKELLRIRARKVSDKALAKNPRGGGSVSSPIIAPGSRPRTVTAVRHWSGPDYTRVVIEATGPVSFKKGVLPPDAALGLPPRMYLDLSPARTGRDLKDILRIEDSLLRAARVAQFAPETVRVVFDLANTRQTKVFYLDDPFRVVVDAFGKGYSKAAPCPSPSITGPTGKELSLTQQLGLCTKLIMVDAGHGGKDTGAVGPSGLKEKDVTLKIAKKVADLLEKDPVFQVVLTRNSDRFLRLEQRTALANSRKADLFVSIHANSSKKRRASGIETFYLNFALDEDAMEVAATENALSTKRIADLQNIVKEIMQNTKISDSSRLASDIQEELVGEVKKTYGKVRNRGVKQAPFIVLIGAEMPSVLVETSFISNRREERRFRSEVYLDRIAQGIVKGIRRYARDTNMASVPAVSAGHL